MGRSLLRLNHSIATVVRQNHIQISVADWELHSYVDALEATIRSEIQRTTAILRGASATHEVTGGVSWRKMQSFVPVCH